MKKYVFEGWMTLNQLIFESRNQLCPESVRTTIDQKGGDKEEMI